MQPWCKKVVRGKFECRKKVVRKWKEWERVAVMGRDGCVVVQSEEVEAGEDGRWFRAGA
jgi:hypothetical protein